MSHDRAKPVPLPASPEFREGGPSATILRNRTPPAITQSSFHLIRTVAPSKRGQLASSLPEAESILGTHPKPQLDSENREPPRWPCTTSSLGQSRPPSVLSRRSPRRARIEVVLSTTSIGMRSKAYATYFSLPRGSPWSFANLAAMAAAVRSLFASKSDFPGNGGVVAKRSRKASTRFSRACMSLIRSSSCTSGEPCGPVNAKPAD
jgi:hypothetical protein